MGRLSDHAKGLSITALGVLILTPDSLLVRLIEADHWTVVFWRGVLVSLALGIGLVLVHRRDAWDRCRAVGRTGVAVAFAFAIAGIAFIYALTHTSVANTLIIVSAAPLFAALFARPILGERVAGRTWLAIAAAIVGIAIAVSDGLGGSSLEGDLAALAAAIALAAEHTLIRRGRETSMIPALVLAGLIAALLVLPLARPFELVPRDVPLLLLMGIVILPASVALMTMGPRYIPAAEVGLLLLLEVVLGPVWVWWVLDEVPSDRALIGGAVVVGTLALNAIIGLRQGAVAGIATGAVAGRATGA